MELKAFVVPTIRPDMLFQGAWEELFCLLFPVLLMTTEQQKEQRDKNESE
jgi:hypothetical protein